jgi:ATP-binding cassette subfamily F protein 3
VKQHIGDVYEFIKNRKIENLSELEVKEVKAKANVKVEENSESEEYRKKQKEQSQIRNRISKIEGEVAKLEKDIKSIDDKLNDPQQYQAVINDQKTFQRYDQMKKELEEKMAEWERLGLQLD